MTRTASPRASPWLTLGVISTVQLMVVLESSVMNVARSREQADLGFDIVGQQHSLGFWATRW